MAKITFYGAVGTVTGSKFMLELKDRKIMIDCGMFQGKKENRLMNWEPFPVPPQEIEKIILTHGHIDHSGYLPRFCKMGFSGDIHCTHSTADLCQILLRDSAHIQEEDARWANKKGYSKHDPARPLYTAEDAENALRLFKPYYYGEDFYFDSDYRLKFKDAGHLLGSAFVDIKNESDKPTRKIVFSGDIGRPRGQFLRDPVQIFNVDYLVLESTYGDRLHDPVNLYDEFARIIQRSFDRGGVLIIPAFAVGRTQTLLYMIRELEEAGRIPSLPVYVDSPMAVDTTDIFRRRIADMNLSSRLMTLEGTRIFRPAQLHLCKTRDDSKRINDVRSRAIIISSSGMATAGRILHHLAQRLPDPRNTVLFSGFQVEGTRGRSMLEGNRNVKIHGDSVPVKAHVESLLGFSGHADYNEILAWLHGFNKAPEKVFIVHGEPEASDALAQKIRDNLDWDAVIPHYGESFEIDL
ncbi:MAG: MBL fold metallo-hydrolase [candidate division Zixibacteria bacterium]|nr:MBL fold metallo-hydrolase [candidate division Zixibacteria bacterium]